MALIDDVSFDIYLTPDDVGYCDDDCVITSCKCPCHGEYAWSQPDADLRAADRTGEGR